MDRRSLSVAGSMAAILLAWAIAPPPTQGFGGGGRGGPPPAWIPQGYDDHKNMMDQLGIKALRPGVTFTYMGLAIDRECRVQLQDGSALQNVFAAGEIMSGNVLSSGYLGGFGLTIGTVFGRIAGRAAARGGD